MLLWSAYTKIEAHINASAWSPITEYRSISIITKKRMLVMYVDKIRKFSSQFLCSTSVIAFPTLYVCFALPIATSQLDRKLSGVKILWKLTSWILHLFVCDTATGTHRSLKNVTWPVKIKRNWVTFSLISLVLNVVSLFCN